MFKYTEIFSAICSLTTNLSYLCDWVISNEPFLTILSNEDLKTLNMT